MHSVFSAVEPLATEKKLGFKVEVPAGPADGHGDERRLTQVLLNLVGNAIKFTDTGEVAIRAPSTNGSFTLVGAATPARAFRGRSEQDFRGIPAGRQLGHQEEGRHRARPVDLEADHRDARRQDLGRIRARQGLGVLVHVADPGGASGKRHEGAGAQDDNEGKQDAAPSCGARPRRRKLRRRGHQAGACRGGRAAGGGGKCSQSYYQPLQIRPSGSFQLASRRRDAALPCERFGTLAARRSDLSLGGMLRRYGQIREAITRTVPEAGWKLRRRAKLGRKNQRHQVHRRGRGHDQGAAADGAYISRCATPAPGISETDQAEVFEEFQQVDNSSTKKGRHRPRAWRSPGASSRCTAAASG